MKCKKLNPRIIYSVCFAVIVALEVVIALFVSDAFIRPYGGDILVTALLCCLVRIFFPKKIRLLPVWVFLFSVVVEILQFFDYASLLGLSDIAFFRIAMGNYFSFIDIICYGVGCVLFWVCETVAKKLASVKPL